MKNINLMNKEYLHPILFLLSFLFFISLKYISEYFKLTINLKSLFHTTIVLSIVLYLYFSKRIPSIQRLKQLSVDNPVFSLKNISKNQLSKSTRDSIYGLIIFSMVFSIFDIYYGLVKKRYDFIIHGVIFFLCVISCYYFSVLVYPYVIIIELSTIFYNFLYTKNIYIIIAFVVTFFITRIIYLNYFTYISYCYFNIKSIETKLLLFYLCVLNLLNLFWFYKIICKSYKTLKKE